MKTPSPIEEKIAEMEKHLANSIPFRLKTMNFPDQPNLEKLHDWKKIPGAVMGCLLSRCVNCKELLLRSGNSEECKGDLKA